MNRKSCVYDDDDNDLNYLFTLTEKDLQKIEKQEFLDIIVILRRGAKQQSQAPRIQITYPDNDTEIRFQHLLPGMPGHDDVVIEDWSFSLSSRSMCVSSQMIVQDWPNTWS